MACDGNNERGEISWFMREKTGYMGWEKRSAGKGWVNA